MKKAGLELAVLFLALGMVMLVGVLPLGGAAALAAVGGELLLAWLIRGLYQAILREERRAIRRARQRAQALRTSGRRRQRPRAAGQKQAGAASDLRAA